MGKETMKNNREITGSELERKVDDILTRGVVEVIDLNSLRERMLSGKPLRVKLGIDPTGPDIHIGRGATLKKLREFQDLGHQVVLIIGDFTAQIGDSSDKPEGRKRLTSETIDQNLVNYLSQIGKIVDLSKAEVRHNSEWLGKLSAADWINLASNFTVQQMISRDNFANRLDKGLPVGLHELLYPLAQGYDSVAVEADVEMGGTDQLFNLHAGRKLQEVYGQKPQDIISMQLMIGTDGRKMSTSWGNVIRIIEAPAEKYGKIMSIPDQLIPVYMEMLTDIPMDEIRAIEQAIESGTTNPMEAKKRLAYSIVKTFDGEALAEEAQKHFERVVQHGELPESETIPEAKVGSNSIDLDTLLNLIKRHNLAKSKGEAKRLIMQRGVYIIRDGQEEVVKEDTQNIDLGEQGVMLKVGKRRFLKLSVGEETA